MSKTALPFSPLSVWLFTGLENFGYPLFFQCGPRTPPLLPSSKNSFYLRKKEEVFLMDAPFFLLRYPRTRCPAFRGVKRRSFFSPFLYLWPFFFDESFSLPFRFLVPFPRSSGCSNGVRILPFPLHRSDTGQLSSFPLPPSLLSASRKPFALSPKPF